MTSDPLIRLVSNDELDPLIQAFLDDCRLARLAPRTIDFYAGNLQRFHWWCVTFNVPLDPAEQTKDDLRQFLRYVQSAENRWGLPEHHGASQRAGATTHKHYHATLRRFFNWLVKEEEYLERSPVSAIRAPRRVEEQPDPFSREELERLVTALDQAKGSAALRDRTIVAVLLDIGLRVSELCALQASNIDVSSGAVNVIAGKGGKSRTLRLGAHGRRSVRRYWLSERRDYGMTGGFFLTIDGRNISRNTVRLMLDRLAKRADVHPNNPHRYRHTAAVEAIRAGMNLFLVQTMLGHSSLEMTKRYAKLVESDLAEAAQEHSALDHLRLKL